MTKPETKTIFIESTLGYKKVGRWSFEKTGERKSIFGGLLEVDKRRRVWTEYNSTEISPGTVDGEVLAKSIDEKTIELIREGYLVESVIPVVNGFSEKEGRGKNALAYGFSYTSGCLLHCRLVDANL